jgi:hypothetical protein
MFPKLRRKFKVPSSRPSYSARHLEWDPGTLTRYLNGTWRIPPDRVKAFETFLAAEEADTAPMHRLPWRR